MKAKELIKKLQEFDGELEVYLGPVRECEYKKVSGVLIDDEEDLLII